MSARKIVFGRNGAKRRSFFSIFLRIVAVCAVVAACFFASAKIFSSVRDKNRLSEHSFSVLLESGEYDELYSRSCAVLKTRPLCFYALLYKGFASYCLAVSQPDAMMATAYIDDAINSLRVALKMAKKDEKGQIFYMLGKSYCQKNSFLSYHYYADSAARYLKAAIDEGYEADDIYEYLGISCASIGETDESIKAFTDALFIRTSAHLLFAIAEQYCKKKDFSMAKQYFARIIDANDDDVLILKCRLALAQIHRETGDFDKCEDELKSVIAMDANFADAYFLLGELYEKRGEPVKARAEYRRILKIQANHAGARQKLSP